MAYNVGVLDETVVRFAEARKKLPGGPSRETVRNWTKTGLLAANDQRVFLEWAKMGRSPVTSVEAFKRFSQKLGRGLEDD